MTHVKKCIFCNNEYITKNIKSKYCSLPCRYKSKERKFVTVNCKICNTEFTVPECKKNSYATCSKDCSKIYFKNIHEAKFEKVRKRKPCEYCGEVFQYKTSEEKRYKRRFCCVKCRNMWESENKTGENHHNFGKKYSKEKINKMREITVGLYEKGVYNKTQTKPQVKINEVLKNNSILYKNEYGFKYYLIDNYLLDFNLAIEVMGDYFHSNPFKYTTLNKMQSINVTKDKRKRTYLRKYHGIEILYLWETDINNNIELCKYLILHYIENNGIIENYNSFNYEIINNNLRLKNNIVQHYMDIPKSQIKSYKENP